MDRQGINFEPVLIHKEDIGDNEYINNASTDIVSDIENLDNIIIDYAEKFKTLQEVTKMRLNAINKKLEATRDIQQDINILCNKHSSFASAINITEANSSTTLLWDGDVLSLKPTSTEKARIKITSIDGNGYEGNNYVYVNDGFIKNVINTSSHENIIDNAINTSFEYSRITTNDKDTPAAFNKDSIEAECSVEIESETAINKININSDKKDLILKEILLSDDGIIYKKYKEYNIKINDRDEKYENPEYIFTSGIIAIKPSKFIKMILKSSGVTNETIAFIKAIAEDNNDKVIEKVIISKSSKRHLVKINDISCFKNKYSKGSLITNELADSPVSCIAILANEYIQEGYSIEDNVSYFLIVNGIEHKVTPINAHRNGIKIIKVSANNFNRENVKYITEEIKSIKLKISIDTPTLSMSPYISNLKILTGGK